MSLYNRKKISGVLYVVIAYVLVILLVGNYFAFSYASLVSTALGQSAVRIEQDKNAANVDSEYYKGEYLNFNQLVAAETEFANDVTAEGSVLLQNAGLPLSSESNITLLGVDSNDSVFLAGGGGSGAVNTSRASSIADAFGRVFNVNTAAVAFFASQRETQPEIAAVEEALADSIADYHDAAIVFIGRAGGEGRDVTLEQAQLTQQEKDLIDYAIANFDKAVVILNTMNPMELGYLEGKNVSVLWIGGTGEVMVGAIPEVLKGTRYPSGKLVDTYAYDIMSAPAMMNFGDYDLTNVPEETRANKYVNLAEGIYVGYRYYETRYADVVAGTDNAGNFDYDSTILYPFGYGLSYTTFEYSDFSIRDNGDSFTATVTVTNTGANPGKEAVEIYMQSPYTEYDKANGVEKSAAELVGFAKTKELAAGASETLTIEIDKDVMKAYDAKGAKTYIVDDGDYWFAAGENVHAALNNILAAQGYSTGGNAALAGSYHQAAFDAETYSHGAYADITNQFDDASLAYYDSSVVYLSRSDWEGTYPTEGASREATAEMLAKINPAATLDANAVMPTTDAQNGLVLASFLTWNEDGTEAQLLDYDDELWDDLLDELSADELMLAFAQGGYGTPGLSSVNKNETTDNDGPAGFAGIIMGGSNTFGYPTEIVFASTWNVELLEKMGDFIGEDGLFSGNTGWYGPAVNIHRTPLSGRNFEYYSEDPFLSGVMVSAVSKAAQAKGVLCFTKHFALNEQETNRSTVCTFATEQAIREIYLYGFEQAVRQGNTQGIMNSMNRVGMDWAGASYPLLTAVCRNEWGFHGVMITDAANSLNAKNDPTLTLLAGTDMFLCTNRATFEIAGYAANPAVMTALRQAAHRILYAYGQSNSMNGMTSGTRVVAVTPPWQIALIIADIVLGIVGIGGIVLLTLWTKKAKKEA